MLSELTSALNDAREATGDDSLGHSISKGKFRLVRVTYDARGRSTVEEIGEPLPFVDHLARLKAMVDDETKGEA